MDTWFVYMVRCRDGSLYTGIAMDVERRVQEHNHNDQLAAKHVIIATGARARRPVQLVYREGCAVRSQAARREYEIKRLSVAHKRALIR